MSSSKIHFELVQQISTTPRFSILEGFPMNSSLTHHKSHPVPIAVEGANRLKLFVRNGPEDERVSAQKCTHIETTHRHTHTRSHSRTLTHRQAARKMQFDDIFYRVCECVCVRVWCAPSRETKNTLAHT